MVVEYGRTMRIFVVASWLFVAGGAIAVAFASERERILAVCAMSAFFLMVLSLHLEFLYVVTRYDSTGLHLTSPWRRSRVVPWSAITGARFSHALQWYVLSTTSFGHIRLHLYLSGLRSLLDELSARGISIPAAMPLRK
jgi:hypothetical protein